MIPLPRTLMHTNSLKYNRSPKAHAEFFAWLLDTRAEHNLKEFPVYLLTTTLSTMQDFYRYELGNIDISLNKTTITLRYQLTQITYTTHIKVTHLGIDLITEENRYTLPYKQLFHAFILPLYHYTSGYQGKKIIRVFINESKLIDESIYQESHKASLGKKKFFHELGIAPNTKNSIKILKKSGELLPYKKIQKLQKKDHTLAYGSVFNKHSFDIFGYKLTSAKKALPSVMSIGSSRAHFFRECFFTQPFYNASYTMTYLQEGIRFIEKLPATATPKLLLVCVEFWWFHPHHYKEVPFLPLHTTHHHFDVDYINKLYEYYYDGILTQQDIHHIMKRKNYASQYRDFKGAGLRASKSAEGYFHDGYYWYATSLHTPNVARNNKLCLDMMQNNFFHFEASTTISQTKIKIFEKFLHTCAKKQITPILILPPFMKKTTNKLLGSKHYSYIHDVIDHLGRYEGVEFYNFLDPKSVHTPKAEFYDCYHGGDITYARILRTILQNKNSALHNFCSIKSLDAIIHQHKNNITLKEEIYGAHPSHLV